MEKVGADQDLKHCRVTYQNGAVQVLGWKEGWELHSHKERFYLVTGYWEESHEGLWNGANSVFVIHIF